MPRVSWHTVAGARDKRGALKFIAESSAMCADRIASPDTSDGLSLIQHVLSHPAALELFNAAVGRALNHDILGRQADSFNVDRLAFLAAGIDSANYVVEHMAKVARFNHSLTLLDSVASQVPPDGLILEFGVYSGTTINRIAQDFPGRAVHGFDSFEGLPETWRVGYEKGVFGRPDLPAVAGNVELVVGWFDRTLPGFLEARPNETAALVHVDCDLYSSTQTIFAQIAPHIRPGTIIVFDEYYNYPGWRHGEYKAFQEFVDFRKVRYEYIGLVPNHQQVAVRILKA